MPPVTVLPDPFAILIQRDLTVKRFRNKDDLKAAIDSLRSQNLQYQVYRYHHGAETYTPCEDCAV